MRKSTESWSVRDVLRLYEIKSKTALLNAEKDGRIPTAARNTSNIRYWSNDDIHLIGEHYGFLNKLKDSDLVTVCIFTAKGGVLKTTITFSLARLFALNGFKVLVVGNDPQTSLTQVCLNPLIENKSIDELPDYQDLGRVLFQGKSLNEVVQKTSLPNLDLLPETSQLTDVGDHMGTMAALAANSSSGKPQPRYAHFKNVLNPAIKKAGYDIVFYDNGPSLTILAENALFASDYWLTPTGCDQGSYQVFEKNFNKVLDFADHAKKTWEKIFLVPTLKDTTKLSMQIYGFYLSQYTEFATQSFIRRTIKAQEALCAGVSPTELFLGSDLSQDFINISKEIWSHISKKSNRTTH